MTNIDSKKPFSIILLILLSSIGLVSAAEPSLESHTQRSYPQLQNPSVTTPANQATNNRPDIQQRLESMSDREKSLFRSMNEMSQKNQARQNNANHHSSDRGGKGKGRGKRQSNGQSRYGMGYEARQNNQQLGTGRGRNYY